VKLTVIADEVSGVGWRLIGARVLLAAADTALDCFRDALRSADMVLITAENARAIPPAELSAALLAFEPLVLEIADLRHIHEPPEIEHEVRRALGVAV
jgi:vacuolar-type H+-ATPase subunit F/Vma7